MDFEFRSLFSGSTGNATLVRFKDTLLLVDAGRTGKMLEEAVCAQGYAMKDVRAILLTHEHIDHIKGVGVLARKYGMEVYASPGTWAGMEGKVGEIPAAQHCEFVPGQDFYIDRVDVLPFPIPHDAFEPTGYALECDGHKAGLLTDLGHATKETLSYLCGVEAMVLEANHDVQMLRDGAYPDRLKRRILSNKGHLSNVSSGEALCQLLNSSNPHVYLGHLSEENNVPELAYSTVAEILRDYGAKLGQDVKLHMTFPDHAAEAYIG